MRPVAELNDYLAEVVGGPCDEALLLRALTHRSYSYENDGLPHNERLEFLGDAVLGIVVTDTVPSALNYVSCTAGSGTCGQSGGVVTWNIPTIGAASETLTFTATVKSSANYHESEARGEVKRMK